MSRPASPVPRVLLVGGPPLYRHRIVEGLQATGMVVVAEAVDCAGALGALGAVPVDVIVLDMDLPGGGLSCLQRLLGSHLRPVVVVAAPQERDSVATLEALAMGAVDFVVRPARDDPSVQAFVEELAGKVRALAGLSPSALADHIARRSQLPSPVGWAREGTPRQPARKVVAMGASTGGPAVLEEILSRLPADLPACVLVTQHMPAGFTAMLARRLHERSPLPVYEGFEGAPVEAGLVYVAPGGFHMTVDEQHRIHLDTGPAVHFVRPSVDVMLRSVAERFGPNVLAVILTGMGNDGTEGVRHVKRAGGRCLVQLASSCVVAGMPMSVVKAGLADQALRPEELARAIVQWAREKQ